MYAYLATIPTRGQDNDKRPNYSVTCAVNGNAGPVSADCALCPSGDFGGTHGVWTYIQGAVTKPPPTYLLQ